MTFSKILFPAAVFLTSAPLVAGVVVIGTTSARSCYEAAEASSSPSLDQLSQCDRALTLEPLTEYEVVATHVNRGILHVRRGNADSGIRDFDRAIALNPSEPEAYLNKAAALIRAGQAQAALPLLDTALAKKTKKPALAYFARGIAHEELGKVQSAYRDYRRASNADPKWALPRNELLRFKVR
jgi:tetratricopeptide (TPR) repeat protein